MAKQTIAVMQPYFYPYLPYFSLMAAVDTFVIYDCVQFPRRGRVHRTQYVFGGKERWLSLPLSRQPRSALIKDLSFRPNATADFHWQLKRYPGMKSLLTDLPGFIADAIRSDLTDVIEYLMKNLVVTAEYLELSPQIIRSSDLNIDQELRGQDRILAIARTLKADSYVNASGGRSLYQAEEFTAEGIQLRFLPPYQGPRRYILNALADASVDELRRETICVAQSAV